MGHVSHASRHGHTLKYRIIYCLNFLDISSTELLALGYDGPNVNVGARSGIITLIAKAIDRLVNG